MSGLRNGYHVADLSMSELYTASLNAWVLLYKKDLYSQVLES